MLEINDSSNEIGDRFDTDGVLETKNVLKIIERSRLGLGEIIKQQSTHEVDYALIKQLPLLHQDDSIANFTESVRKSIFETDTNEVNEDLFFDHKSWSNVKIDESYVSALKKYGIKTSTPNVDTESIDDDTNDSVQPPPQSHSVTNPQVASQNNQNDLVLTKQSQKNEIQAQQEPYQQFNNVYFQQRQNYLANQYNQQLMYQRNLFIQRTNAMSGLSTPSLRQNLAPLMSLNKNVPSSQPRFIISNNKASDAIADDERQASTETVDVLEELLDLNNNDNVNNNENDNNDQTEDNNDNNGNNQSALGLLLQENSDDSSKLNTKCVSMSISNESSDILMEEVLQNNKENIIMPEKSISNNVIDDYLDPTLFDFQSICSNNNANMNSSIKKMDKAVKPGMKLNDKSLSQIRNGLPVFEDVEQKSDVIINAFDGLTPMKDDQAKKNHESILKEFNEKIDPVMYLL